MLAGAFSQWPGDAGAGGDSRRGPRRALRRLSPARSTWPSGSASRCIRRSTSRPSLAGEDAELTARLGAAYIRGFQGGTLGTVASVATMVKHFPGGGPQKDGEDPHFAYGREQVYPGGEFELHLRPFVAALRPAPAR